ncbi:hypothetical protein [Paenibacillus sp. UNC451MF]|uniref:hypothetical protein n=1 Tax=Paenibacillus sp. UNC451MF TaxID=1449063 RepID=UPI00048C2B8A|nr:hypothetical protein [Paenibacillus sp. UNC451MF]
MLSVYRKSIVTISLLLTLFAITILTGCTDNKQLKQDLLQAINKQQDVANYRFEGSIDLHADSSLFGQANPIAASLFSLIKESKLEFKGVAALEPARMETNLTVTPNGGSPISIPVLIKDSKLFFQMPPLNKPDEYMMLPIQNKQASSNGSTEPLKNTGQLTANLTQQLFKDIDPKWLQTSKEAAALSDGTTVKRITLEINKKNEQAFADYMNQSVVPGLQEIIKTNGLAASSSVDSWTTTLGQIKVKAPSTITLMIDNEGYIREQQWNLSFTSGSSTNENKLNWTYTISDINKNPAFTQETPAKVKSLEDLLRLVKPANAAKK